MAKSQGTLIRKAGAALVVVTAAAAAMFCGGSPAAPDGAAVLQVMLTDAATDDVEEVNVYFTSVTAKPVDGPPRELVLELTPNPVDLLTLSGTVTEFAAAAVEPGAYEYIHVNIDEARSFLVENGVEKPLKVPSQEVKVVGGFVVDENALTTVTVDFDAEASLVSLGNGEWLLKPVVVVAAQDVDPMP